MEAESHADQRVNRTAHFSLALGLFHLSLLRASTPRGDGGQARLQAWVWG